MLYTDSMTETKMLQAIVDSIALLRKDMNDRFEKIETKMDDGFKKVNKRLDMQGAQLSYLEDDVPTREEFDQLKNV